MSQLAALQNIIRQLSFDRLSTSSPIENLAVTECPNPGDLVYGSWTALILVTGAPFKLTFKAHFKSGQVRSLLSKLRSTSFENVHDEAALDHMKEFCNLIAGGVKTCFSSLNSACGISLPLVIAGFDETLYKALPKGKDIQDIWCLDWGAGSITCTSTLKVFDASKLEQLALDSVATSAKAAGGSDDDFL